MRIKSDRGIRRMAASRDMMEPFEPEWEGYIMLELLNAMSLP